VTGWCGKGPRKRASLPVFVDFNGVGVTFRYQRDVTDRRGQRLPQRPFRSIGNKSGKDGDWLFCDGSQNVFREYQPSRTAIQCPQRSVGKNSRQRRSLAGRRRPSPRQYPNAPHCELRRSSTIRFTAILASATDILGSLLGFAVR